MQCNSSISLKNQSIRKSSRKSYLEGYMKAVRQKIVNSRMKEMEEKELNAKVEQMIAKEDLQGIYESLYRNRKRNQNQEEVPIYHLHSNNIQQLLFFLMKRVNVVKSLLLLYNLFDIHYKTIFLDPNVLDRSKEIVRKLYEQANEVILAWSTGKYKQPQNPNTHINCLLNCLKSLIFDREESQEGFTFSEVVRQDYLVNYVYSWALLLIDNPLYMIILVIVQNDMSISNLPSVKKLLDKDSRLMLKLLQQSNPNNNIFKSNSLPSIILANLFLSNIENKQVLQNLMSPFLQTAKVVYQFAQPAKKEFYRINTLLQTLQSCITIFQRLEQVYMKEGLCHHLAKANYFTFSVIILRSQSYTIRQKIFRLMQHALCNLLVCRGPLQQFMTQSLVGMLGEGLQGQCVDITIASLKCFISIYNYIEGNMERSQKVLRWIRGFDIEPGLENLMHHSNEEIQKLSKWLFEKKELVDKGHKGDMEVELE